MERIDVERALCVASVGTAGLDRTPSKADDGSPPKGGKKPLVERDAERAAAKAVKDEAARRAKAVEGLPAVKAVSASVDPSPRGPVLTVRWTVAGEGRTWSGALGRLLPRNAP